ncbi:MAG: hypothetical protein WBF42_15015 [Terracidiphilus sp.]
MKSRSVRLLSLLFAASCLILDSASWGAAPTQAAAHTPGQGPVPQAVLAAKSVFLSNGGADSGLFPEPFSGDQSRPYAQFYSALKASGQFKLADDPADADLVLELRLIAPAGPTRASKPYGAADPLPEFRLIIYDRKSHYVLWTLNESIQLAFQQRTHDRNFDDALKLLFDDLLKIAGKHTPQTR